MIEDLWYKNAVIYNLDLETFMDANGDGVGDFEGLMRRLDYLHSLGIDTVWLAPFQPTPNRDNGYDVSDFYGVDPRHGSSGDFVAFMEQAKSYGIRVLIDLVVNHTSDAHPWFQAARSDPASPYRDWYLWSEKRPKDWNQGMVFPGVQKATWTRDKAAKAYYFHRFHDFQPDLNLDNPEVRAELQRVVGYWLALGVAGFRVDALPFVLETPAHNGKPAAQHFEYLRELRTFLQWRSNQAVLLGEANVTPEESREYFADDGGVHLMFNFHVNQHLFYALASGDVAPLAEAIEATRELPETAQWGLFLRNHDELDLGRLTETQRQAVFARFGPEPEMQLYGRGVRRRLAPMLHDRRLLELAYSLLFSLPGTPVLYYGDELGIGDDLSLPDRDAFRTPMPWSDGPQAGFSSAPQTFRPPARGVYGFEQVNVEAARRDPNSLLNWTSRMIRLRKECPEIGWGVPTVLAVDSANVLALRYDWRGNALVALHNVADAPCEVRFKVDAPGGERLHDLMREERLGADDGGVHTLVLEAYGYRWFRVGNLDYALTRRRL